MDDQRRLEIEAATFRQLVEHLQARPDMPHIDLAKQAEFFRNRLSEWYRVAALERGVALAFDDVRDMIYGMPYADWHARYETDRRNAAAGEDGDDPPAAPLRHHRERLQVPTPGRATIEITAQVRAAVARSAVTDGQCTVFVHHTSASLMICENADPSVVHDLEAFAARLVPDGDRLFTHTLEGPDDMSAHVRSVLTQSSLTMPVTDGRVDLGTWQGVYLWEHRYAAHTRTVTVTVLGH